MMDQTRAEELDAVDRWANGLLTEKPKWWMARIYELIPKAYPDIRLDACRGIIERREP